MPSILRVCGTLTANAPSNCPLVGKSVNFTLSADDIKPFLVVVASRKIRVVKTAFNLLRNVIFRATSLLSVYSDAP